MRNPLKDLRKIDANLVVEKRNRTHRIKSSIE